MAAALVLFLVVVAAASGSTSDRDDLPSELVEPLQDLHDAVEGTG